jgi:hypothetical protein
MLDFLDFAFQFAVEPQASSEYSNFRDTALLNIGVHFASLAYPRPVVEEGFRGSQLLLVLPHGFAKHGAVFIGHHGAGEGEPLGLVSSRHY